MTVSPPDGAPPVAYCYRHPDRETLLGCGSCERPICTSCLVETPVGMRCPECARGGPVGLDDRIERARVAARGRRTLTIALIALNVVAFVVEYTRAGSGAITTGLLYDLGAVYGPAVADGEWWRMLSGGFLHGGVAHLALNMIALWMLGSILEDGIGVVPMGFIYLASVLAGSAGALALSPDGVTVGASGGVFGLMGALLIIAQQRGVREMTGPLLATLGLNLAFTFAVPGISIGGHLGGLVGGILACLVVSRRGHVRRRPSPLTAVAMVALLGAAVAIGVVAAARSGPDRMALPSTASVPASEVPHVG